MYRRELGQHYLVEIVARAETAKHRCDALLSIDFLSKAPLALTTTIRRTCEYLALAAEAVFNQIDWSGTDDELDVEMFPLKLIDALIQDLLQRLRYVEGAKTDRLPWSIVPAFEALADKVLPDVNVMLRAMWHYSYAFHLEDQRAELEKMLAEYADYVPADPKVLQEMPKPFHIISFPSLERKHILLHTLLGHELGHLLVNRYIDEPKTNAFVDKVKSDVERFTETEVADIPDTLGKIKQATRDRRMSENTRRAITLWRRALEEILSDLAGVCLFGPAALFSTLEMAIQEGYDLSPESPDYYPPWRMRLRYVWRLLSDDSGWFPIPNLYGDDEARHARLKQRVALIEQIISDTPDEESLKKDRLASAAYVEAAKEIPNGLTFLLKDCGLADGYPKPAALYGSVSPLIDRLDHLIPPNAFETSIDDHRMATFAEILNAAWFHRLSLPPVADDGTVAEAAARRNLLNNLTLKAIEFSDLARRYADWRERSESEQPQ